jgi:hypothetical protein
MGREILGTDVGVSNAASLLEPGLGSGIEVFGTNHERPVLGIAIIHGRDPIDLERPDGAGIRNQSTSDPPSRTGLSQAGAFE